MKIGYLKIEKLVEGKIEGYTVGDEINFGTGPVTIARWSSAEPDAIEPDIKIIGDYYVSRSHTLVEIYHSSEDNCFYLQDGGTLNGVFVDGQKLIPHEPHRLKDVTQIVIGKVPGLKEDEIERVIFKFRDDFGTLLPPAEPRQERGLVVDMETRKVFVDGVQTKKDLTKTEWKVFEVLHQQPGKVFEQDKVCSAVWRENGYENNFTYVPKYIQRLRDKIEPDRGNPRFIVTRHNGYALELNND